MPKKINYSYWEIKELFKTWDLLIIGSGIVGLSTAISYKKRNPKHSVIILEKGILSSGASTKNAGFACFGSPGELLDDLSHTPEHLVWQTVQMRWKGLQILRKRLGDKGIDFRKYGGYELFFNKDSYERVKDQIPALNKAMKEHLGISNCFSTSSVHKNQFFGIHGALMNNKEGQIDTGIMMRNLLFLAQQKGVVVLNGVEVKKVLEGGKNCMAISDVGDFLSKRIVVAINGFARQLLKLPEVKPARAQVLITSPIPDLKIKGTFHFDEGFYYFRNIDQRILFGGGRNIDFQTEETTVHELNQTIQSKLDDILSVNILPKYRYKVAHRWTGIMGVGPEKMPVIRRISDNVVAAVRMGGMGVAIGSWVGEQAAKIVDE